RLPAGEELRLRTRSLEQAELAEQLVRARLALPGRHAVVGGVEDQVVANRQGPVEVVALGNDRQVPARLDRISHDVDAADARAPARRANARRQDADRRGLAGAVRAEQSERLSRL